VRLRLALREKLLDGAPCDKPSRAHADAFQLFAINQFVEKSTSDAHQSRRVSGRVRQGRVRFSSCHIGWITFAHVEALRKHQAVLDEGEQSRLDAQLNGWGLDVTFALSGAGWRCTENDCSYPF